MMIKALSGVLCGLLVACGGAAQTPSARSALGESCTGSAVHSAAELAGYRGCARITGDLRITGVASLAALSELRRVDGSLSVVGTERLESLTGLEGLTNVSRLELRDNLKLRDLSALARLGHAREVAVQGNPVLRALEGLSGLTEIQHLSILETSLYSLRGVENLKRVGLLEISDNSELIDPSALNGVREAHEVVVEQNPRLCSHFGFLTGIDHPTRAALSGNIGLDKSSVARFQEPTSRATIAAR
jgi:Leucine-rich repeat (LRR) protein